MRTNAIIASATLVAITVIATAMIYGSLPSAIPIHWNIHGQVDGWGGRAWGAWLMPGIMAALLLLFLALPWLSPRGFTVDGFRTTYEYIALATLALMAFLHTVMIGAALGSTLDAARWITAAIFVYFGLLGPALRHVKRNFWIGVRVPWTLASERVWDETHRLAARIFTVVGFGGCLAILAGLPFSYAIVVLIASALVPVVYSLVRYKKLQRSGEI